MSLLETILAVFLLGLMVLFLFELLPGSVFAIRRGQNQLMAGQLAQSILSERQAASFNQLVVGSSQALDPVTRENLVMRPEVVVEAVPDFEPDQLKSLRVVVRWQDRGRDFEEVRQVYVARVQR